MKKLIALIVIVLFVLSTVGISYAGNTSSRSTSKIGTNNANVSINSGSNVYQTINGGSVKGINSNRSVVNTQNTVVTKQKNRYAPKSVSGSTVYGRIF
jgi:cell division protein YceG involved in septum cleavage